MYKYIKTLKQLYAYSFILILLMPISCIVKPQTNLQAYYEFKDEDFDKLMDFELNQEVIYKEESGETITYYVEQVTDDYKKQKVSGGGGFFGLSLPTDYHFYYDEQTTEFTVNPRIYKIRYTFIRHPLNDSQATENSYSEQSSSFTGFIYFINWNGTQWDGYETSDGILIDFETETISMTVNNITYENVYVITSENTEPLVNGVIIRKANVIYYDKHHGIIGFDETDGKTWRLNN